MFPSLELTPGRARPTSSDCESNDTLLFDVHIDEIKVMKTMRKFLKLFHSRIASLTDVHPDCVIQEHNERVVPGFTNSRATEKGGVVKRAPLHLYLADRCKS